MAVINQDFWLKESSITFKDFFNKNNAKKGHWGIGLNGKQQSILCVSDSDIKLGRIFNNPNIKSVTGNADINIYQFLIMTSIMLNETGGSFVLATSEKGSAEYFFDKIPAIPKISYNTAANGTLGNKTAYDLFHDPIFMNVPARASMYKPKNINDKAWAGDVYPTGEPVGTSGYKPGEISKNYITLGIIGECDFYKFRGRGVIQLTGRGNYSKFLGYIKDNKTTIGANAASLLIINNWGSDSIDNIATKITNTEIDTLFADDACAVLVFKTHSSNKALEKMYNVKDYNEFIDLTFAYGKAIGGKNYGTLFTNRVYEIVENLPDWSSKQTV
jgi:hypothetical protein